jgi:tetratricopeptide (TPR) repeat protein
MSTNRDQQHLQIRQLLQQGRIADCLTELHLMIGIDPEDGKARALFGHVQLRHLEDLEGAESSFRLAMRNSPTYAPLYLDYAELLMRLEKHTETVAVLNRALEVKGIEKDRIHRLMGQVYEKEMRWSEAVEQYTQAILLSFSEEFVLDVRKDLMRIKMKMQLR